MRDITHERLGQPGEDPPSTYVCSISVSGVWPNIVTYYHLSCILGSNAAILCNTLLASVKNEVKKSIAILIR